MKTLGIYFILFCMIGSARAWNFQGHQVIAQIAYNHLDSEVKAKCDALIALPVDCGSSSHTFVSDATWADQRCETGTAAQHYYDIPISLDGSPTDGVFDDTNNVVSALNRHIATLQNPGASQSAQASALRYVLHFVGDIHQPLHASTGVWASNLDGDAGGNEFSIGGNLHSFWDQGAGYLTDGMSTSNKAAAIESSYPYTLSAGVIPDPLSWAVESWTIAKTNVYVGITNGVKASAAYTNRVVATAAQRVAVAGQRLAKLLSTVFVTNTPSLTVVPDPGGDFKFAWAAVPGRFYRVQTKQQLEESDWNDVVDLSTPTNSLSFTDAERRVQRFYRVIVVN